MANKINTSDTLASQMELELLEVLLEPEDATYPWNPADDESEEYFRELEQQFVTRDLLDEELTTRSQNFYEQLDTLWSEVSTSSYYNCNTICASVDSLKETLHTAFVASVPQGWLNAIAQKATDIFASQQSMGEQLVQCVQAVMPTWEADDLFVLARPFAYSMRSSEPQNLKSIISNIENRDWTNLSEIEQAKISIAIAYYALKQLDSFQTEA
ncbi:hypothetical protein I8751_11175 [Nostocaceae cyanobacterium CENA357]|uniref:Uncharacterized protein n=1 Tax=Atlanticothrix silvestris CENA357 TaxID=1725252 RepID=A0A8J7KZJ7_9CYAN|nr:hypothetical protein [Atlanticothrix silvestris]MBH8552920.1 hypothetical protein [Atlanticothrix silvestris CENA357]